MPFQNPSDPSSEEIVGQSALQNMARTASENFAASSAAGERPTQYAQGWSDVQDQFRQQFPNIDPERARAIYEQSRAQGTRSALLGLRQGGEESSGRTWLGRTPLIGGFFQAGMNVSDAGALARIRDHTATQEDYRQAGEHINHETARGGQGFGRQLLDMGIDSASFGLDFALTGGIGGAAGKATSAAVRAGSIGAARSMTPGLAQNAVFQAGRWGGWAAGAAANSFVTANLMPHRLAASVSQEMIPSIGMDPQGELAIGGDRGAGDAFRGYVDHQIEVASEMSGETLMRAGGAVLSRIPGAARAQLIAAGVSARLAANPSLAARLLSASGRSSSTAFSGILGEMLEERAGEIARGALGVRDDYGLTGQLASGRIGALNQLAAEGLAFGVIDLGHRAFHVATRGRRAAPPGVVAVQALQRQGLGAQAAQQQVMTAATAIASGTATPEDLPQGPLRTMAEAINERMTPLQQAGATQAAVAQVDPAVPVQEQAPSAPDVTQTPTTGQNVASDAAPQQESPTIAPAASEQMTPAAVESTPPSAPEEAPSVPFDRLSPEQASQLAKSLGLTVKGLRLAQDKPGVKEAIAATAEQANAPVEAPSPPAPLPQKPSLADRMRSRGQQTVATSAQDVQPPRVGVNAKVRAMPLSKASTTAEVRQIMREAPGYQSQAEMFKEHGLGPVEQAVLTARFDEKYPSFGEVAKMIINPATSKPYSKQRIKQIEAAALGKMGLSQSVHAATVARTASQDVGQAARLEDAVVKGEITSQAAEKKIQDMRDRATEARDRLTDQLAADMASPQLTEAQKKALLSRFEKDYADVKSSVSNRAKLRQAQADQQASVRPGQSPVADQGVAQPAAQSVAPQVAPQPIAAPSAAKVTPKQARRDNMLRGQLARAKNPILRASIESRLRGEEPLYNVVVGRGGLDPVEMNKQGYDVKKLIEDGFPPQLFPTLTGKKAAARSSPEANGYLPSAPSSEHYVQHLLDHIQAGYLVSGMTESVVLNDQLQSYKRGIYEELAARHPSWSSDEIQRQVEDVVEQSRQGGVQAGINEGQSRPAGESVHEALGDAYEGDDATRAAGFESAERHPDDEFTHFHASERAGLIPGDTAKKVMADIARVNAISTHHAAIVRKMMADIKISPATAAKKGEFLATQLAVVARMTNTYAEQVTATLKGTRFYPSMEALTLSLRDQPAVKELLSQGKVIGGSVNASTGVQRLDGGSALNSAEHIAGHESSHLAEGLERTIAKSKGFQNAWKKEIKDGAIGQYATLDADEGLAEVMGQLLSGKMTTEALWKNFPLTAAELEGHDWIQQREGDAGYSKPADTFSEAIHDGPWHADAIKKIVGGVRNFLTSEQGRAAEGKEKFHVGNDISDDVKKLMAPATRGPIAAKFAGALQHGLAEAERVYKENVAATLEAKKYFDKTIVGAADATARQNGLLEIADPLEHGTIPSLPAHLQPLAGKIKTMIAKDEAELRKRSMLSEFIENYFGHIWEKPGATPDDIGRMFRRPLEGSKSFTRERTIPTYREGIDKGLVPVSWNPVELALLKSYEVNKAIMAYDLFHEMKDAGLIKYVRTGAQAPDGWKTLPDKMMRVLMRQKMGMVQTGQYFMPEEGHRILNNYLAPGLSGNSKVYDIAREYSNLLNSAQLGFGVFHAGFVTMDTAASATALALQKLSRGDLSGAGKKALEGLIPGVSLYMRGKEGLEFSKEYYARGTGSPAMQAIVEAAVKGGFHLEMNQMVNGAPIARFRKALSEVRMGNYGQTGGLFRHAIPALSEFVSKPTMSYLVPIMKAGVVADLIRHKMETMPAGATLDQQRAAYHEVVKSVDNRLGEVAYDNLHLNRTFKDVLMVGLRSVGWNIGTAREVGGGIADIKKSVMGIKSGEGISPRTAYIGGLVMTTAIVGVIMQKLLSGKWPEEPKDYFFPKTGRTRRDGSAERLSLPSYMRDIAHVMNRADEGPLRIANNLWSMGKGKINPGLASVIEMLNNENFFGQAIYDPNDPMWRQGLDLISHVAHGLEPFSVRNLHPSNRQLPLDTPTAILGFFGATPAPARVVHSWEQQRAIEMHNRSVPTPLDRLRRDRRGGR